LPPTISAQLLKALEAAEKRVSLSRGFNCIEKAQTRALPLFEAFGTFLTVISIG